MGSPAMLSNTGSQPMPIWTTPFLRALVMTRFVVDLLGDPEPDPHRWAAEGHSDLDCRIHHNNLCSVGQFPPEPDLNPPFLSAMALLGWFWTEILTTLHSFMWAIRKSGVAIGVRPKGSGPGLSMTSPTAGTVEMAVKRGVVRRGLFLQLRATLLTTPFCRELRSPP